MCIRDRVGIDSDGRENSPGARIPIGVEPELCDHIQVECKFHKYLSLIHI